jgi:hypothetical protein
VNLPEHEDYADPYRQLGLIQDERPVEFAKKDADLDALR